MKKLLTIFLLLAVFVSTAQRKFFHANNYFVTQPLPPSMVTNGLVLNLDAGNTSSYLGSGTTWTDLTASGNNGTLTNGPVFNTRNGGNIVFDGIDDVVGFGNILTIGLNSWTMSCWVKFDGGAGIMGIMGKTSYRAYDGRYSFYIENNNINAFFQPSANNIISTPVAPYLDNKFHNLVMTISRSSMMYFYIDGISVGTPIDVSSTSAINLNSTDKFYIGSYGSSNGQSPLYFFKGNVGQALIYNRALSASEVTNNFNVSKARYNDLTIGDAAFGGKIAYLLTSSDPGYDPNIDHGLIAAFVDQGEATNGVAAPTDHGIALANNYRGGGYTDWRLPTFSELNKFYINRVAIGGFDLTKFYWNADISNGHETLINFSNGNYSVTNNIYNIGNVRAVRTF